MNQKHVWIKPQISVQIQAVFKICHSIESWLVERDPILLDYDDPI